jgi:glycosyltransferase involved in cell wall biosynthesis
MVESVVAPGIVVRSGERSRGTVVDEPEAPDLDVLPAAVSVPVAPPIAPVAANGAAASVRTPTHVDHTDRMAVLARSVGIRRVVVVAWRDLDDPEAGGSEVHADELLRRWAAAGIDVVLRTSAVSGLPCRAKRAGYEQVRRSGRYRVFPRVAAELALSSRPDALVEIWNGMPFLSPVWAARVPKAVFLHHVHAEMWQMVLPPTLARIGRSIEERVAPPLYRRTRVVTLSESSRREIVSMLGIPERNVTVVPPGIDERFSRGGVKAAEPLVVAVGRLAAVKRLEQLVETVATLHDSHPSVRAILVGEGYERQRIEETVDRLGAAEYVSLPGRLGPDELVALYRKAWLVVSASAREGWGMTITEAAACGTPSVATAIAGHLDAIEDGVTGLLAPDVAGLGPAMARVIDDAPLRTRLGKAAAARAARFSWDDAALRTLEVLAGEVAAARRLSRVRLPV